MLNTGSTLSPSYISMCHDLIELLPTGELRFHLHAGQAKAISNMRRFIGIVAGTQSGKASFAPIWLWQEIKRCGPGDYDFVVPNFILMEVKALPEIRRLFDDILALGTYTSSPVRKFVFSRSGIKRTLGYDPGKPLVVYFGYAETPTS